MRWPLRNQIFLPFAGLLTVSVILVTVVSAMYAARNSRQQKLQHLEAVTTSLGESGFPLAPTVVERIAPMIDGDVVVIDSQRRITASTLPASQDLADQLTALSAGRLSDTDYPRLQTAALTWNSKEYLVSMVRHRHVARVQTLYVLVPQEDFLALQRDSILPPLIVAVPTLILALLLAMMISGRIGGRVHRLKELFRSLSLGNFQTVSVAGRHDELRDLLISANELAARLNQMREELLLAERLQLLGQLSGGLAHQLKNSITGARMAIQLHQKQSLSDSSGSQMLETAIAQLKLTEEQVKAVLSLRPNQDPVVAEVETDLCELIQDVRGLLVPQCEHWKSEVRLALPKDCWPVRLQSASCMKGALLNLVLNAIEAAGVGGCVEIILEPEQDEFIGIQILDNGPGFKHAPEKLTEAFLTTKQEGIGLGLTIAMHAVQQENGELIMERIHDRTCVRILLPAPVVEEVQG